MSEVLNIQDWINTDLNAQFIWVPNSEQLCVKRKKDDMIFFQKDIVYIYKDNKHIAYIIVDFDLDNIHVYLDNYYDEPKVQINSLKKLLQ